MDILSAQKWARGVMPRGPFLVLFLCALAAGGDLYSYAESVHGAQRVTRQRDSPLLKGRKVVSGAAAFVTGIPWPMAWRMEPALAVTSSLH